MRGFLFKGCICDTLWWKVSLTQKGRYNKPKGWVKGQLCRVEIEEQVKWGLWIDPAAWKKLRSWGANRTPGCSWKHLQGHKDPGQGLCAVWKNLDFHGGWNSCGCHEHPSQQDPAICHGLLLWSGCEGEWGLSAIPPSWGPSPSHSPVPVSEMTVPELFLSVVKHSNDHKAQPLLASLCHVWLVQRAEPSTLLGTHDPMAQPLTTPHPAAMLPFHPPATVLLSHIIHPAASLNNSSATTEILWIYWCGKKKKSIFFPFSYFLKGTALQWKVKLVPSILCLVTLFCPLSLLQFTPE